MSKYFATVYAILMVVTIFRCNVERGMKFDKLEYLVGEIPTAPQALRIDASGRARYESHTNETTPDHPEIGIYETTLHASEVQSLVGMLDNPPFNNLPDHWGRVLSGERYRRIRVTVGSEMSEKLIGTREPVDPEMHKVIDALDQIVVKVKSHPQQTLRIELIQPTISPEWLLTATMSLSNTGVQPVNCRNPLNLLSAPDGRLTIQAWPDKPPSNLRAEDLATANVNIVEDLRPPSGRRPTASVIKLPPKGSVSFRIQASLPLKSAGAYVVRVLYTNVVEQLSGQRLIVGDLFSKTDKVNVSVPSNVSQ